MAEHVRDGASDWQCKRNYVYALINNRGKSKCPDCDSFNCLCQTRLKEFHAAGKAVKIRYKDLITGEIFTFSNASSAETFYFRYKRKFDLMRMVV